MLNPKSQINPKSQNFKPVSFGHWLFGHGLLFVIWCLVIGICGCASRSMYKDSRVMMGTFVEVVSPDRNAAKIAFAEIKRIEDLLSKYELDSEVSRLNKSGKLNVSPDTLYIIKKAKEFWLITDGAFDITVGPLMDLWGFTDKKYRLPQKPEIESALNLVGSDKIIIDESKNVVEFKLPGMKIDLGGVAKGYALDCAAKKLKENNIKSCLINAGGQVYCLGAKSAKPWKVAIKSPRSSDITEYLQLQDQSAATSGDYEQYFVKDDKRYMHILNPKTGYPADKGIISVTVIAPSGLTADALSTSIFVLGKAKGLSLAERFLDVEVKITEEKVNVSKGTRVKK
jgi:thiamine biosynthesis lipoprotein